MSSREFAVPLPPHRQYRDFLTADELSGLLDYSIANRERFMPSCLAGKVVDPEWRRSVQLGDLGPFRGLFDEKLRAMADELFASVGTRPFDIDYIELEMVAHNDGAHFRAHSDIPVGPGRERLGGDSSGRHDRLLSGVFYYHRVPTGFSGGELRLHRFGGQSAPGDHVDIAPERNSLLIFPSWAIHEVRPVRCASGLFEDSRFAINAWLCRADR